MNRKQEIEKYLMPLLPEEPKEITATALQREYKNGYLDGQKKAYDECDEIARELSQIKSGCSKWLDKHDAKIRADAIDEMKDKLQLSAIYTETENGWSGMTVDTIQIEEIANELKEHI